MKNFFSILFFIVAVFLFTACENNEEEVYNLNKREFGVERAREVNINFTQAGKTKAILTSPLMLKVQDSVPYIEFPDSLHVDFYNANQQKESKLDAQYARYRENEKIVFLKDSVRIINMLSGDTLYCNELYWDRSRIGNEFYTDKPVRVRTKTIQQNGRGLDASQDFKNWHITYPTGSIELPPGQFTP